MRAMVLKAVRGTHDDHPEVRGLLASFLLPLRPASCMDRGVFLSLENATVSCLIRDLTTGR